MGRSIYLTDREINQLIIYAEEALGILGQGEDTWQQTEIDMNNGLGSALRKLYRGKIGERAYEKYKTK